MARSPLEDLLKGKPGCIRRKRSLIKSTRRTEGEWWLASKIVDKTFGWVLGDVCLNPFPFSGEEVKPFHVRLGLDQMQRLMRESTQAKELDMASLACHV